MTVREGVTDVRVFAGGTGDQIRQKIEAAMNAELAETGERLVRLLDRHWTGFADGIDSPYMIYRNVRYEAEPWR
ncbi:hypothetical protein EB72_11720 [Mycobacterium sp. SWH-M1]|nr:hypothetical protein EB72_11720 [Mycobacterium sp. SWH-M1]